MPAAQPPPQPMRQFRKQALRLTGMSGFFGGKSPKAGGYPSAAASSSSAAATAPSSPAPAAVIPGDRTSPKDRS